MENILFWFLLGYLGWQLLKLICPIRAKIIVRLNPMQQDAVLPDTVLSAKLLPKTGLEALFKARFVQITTAYAAGQLQSVRSFMTDTVFQTFQSAIQKRQEQGHYMDYKLVDFKKVDFPDTDENTHWVDFETEQINLLKDKDEKIIEGDPMYLSLVKERWQFRWDEKAGWVLSAVKNVEAHAA